MHPMSIPTCYFPSTALFLDDSHDFLLNFVLQLDEGMAYRIFDTPTKALNYIQQKPCELDLVNQLCMSESMEIKRRHLTKRTIELDLSAIHAEVYNPHRFSEVSVVVVDYAMPGMDGLEFCRRIENDRIKKILLTGQADEQLAIAAFNEGLIHRYIKKNEVNVAALITKSIHELQAQYFQAMSDTIVRMLSLKYPSGLQDKPFTEFFRALCVEHGIIEYYLIDHSGSFILLDDDANVSLLVVKNAEDVRAHYDFAHQHGADSDLLYQLAKGELIPAVWPAQEGEMPFQEWVHRLVPAKQCMADDTYYYAYLTANIPFDIRQRKILSYHRYLEELDAQELLLP